MSLMSCPECGNKISDSADSCPKCGAVITEEDIQRAKKWRKVKSWIWLAVAAIVGGYLLGNALNDTEESNKQASAPAEQAISAASPKQSLDNFERDISYRTTIKPVTSLTTSVDFVVYNLQKGHEVDAEESKQLTEEAISAAEFTQLSVGKYSLPQGLPENVATLCRVYRDKLSASYETKKEAMWEFRHYLGFGENADRSVLENYWKLAKKARALREEAKVALAEAHANVDK